jgi:hypothetical protein
MPFKLKRQCNNTLEITAEERNYRSMRLRYSKTGSAPALANSLNQKYAFQIKATVQQYTRN